ncbi:unnamed protein product [Rotaria sordida]|uniref:Uncharacterized protein n=1 Tax=Rotaria sordida TaxID=392033 RepID=A0A815E3J9_9BILA|nr:unnamed protein product [Rotaria sordida]
MDFESIVNQEKCIERLNKVLALIDQSSIKDIRKRNIACPKVHDALAVIRQAAEEIYKVNGKQQNLDDSDKPEIEMEVVAEVWCGSVIDEYPAVAEYIDPPASTLDKLCLIEIHDYFSVCEEEAEEPIEHQVGQSDEYYQERVCPPHITTDGELLRDAPKYDIDEYWCATHVLQTQYTIQIVRCNSISGCGLWHSNYIQVFPHRFLPAPVAFERTPCGIAMAERDYQKGVFYGSLIHRIQFYSVVMQHTQNDILPFDYYCSSVRKELKRHICSIRKQYISSAYRMKNHCKIHQQQYASNCLDYDEDMFSNENSIGNEHDRNEDEFK